MSPRRSPLLPLNLFMLLFAFSAILGVWPAYDPNLSLGAMAALLLSVALYFGVAYLARSPARVRAASIIALLVAAAFGLYFVTQYDYFGFQKGGFISRLGDMTSFLPNLRGFTPFPNAAATFLEVAVPLGVALAVSSRKTASKIAWAVATLIVAYAIFLTASRGAWVALVAVAGLALALVVLSRLPRRAATLLVGLGVIAAIAGLLAIVALGPDRLPFLASTFSRASDRGRLFQNSLYLAGDYAFTGIGLGDTFGMVYSRYSLLIFVPYLTYAHNLPLSVWLNQGLLGLIAMGGAVVAFYLYVRRVNRLAQPPAAFHGAWLGATATLLHGLTDAPQYAGGNRWAMPMLFAWMGLTAAAGELALREARPDTSTPSRSLVRPIVAGALVMAMALLVIFSQPIRAAWHTNLGAIDETRAELAPGRERAERRAGYETAGSAYRTALDIDPAWPNANRRAGNLAVNLDRFDEAVPLLEASYTREPDNPAAIKGLGLAYTWVGRSQDAARLLLRLDDPASMSSELYTWANYRLEQNQPLLAAYAFEAAQAMYPDSTGLNVWLAIAEAYRAADRLDAARAWYNRVLEVEPDNERARQALQALQP